MIEAWRRIDTRITYQDILDRQRSDPVFGGIGLKKLTKNALQNHCYRDCRKILNNWVEYGRRDEPHRTEVETIEELTYNQIVYNTVLRESSTFKGRLVRLTFRREKEDGLFRAVPVQVTPANVRRTTFDILHFMDGALPMISPDNHMTPSMDAAWQMSLLLTERAQMHGKQHWSKLDRQCLPITWYDRLKASKKTVSNPTYDGGCAVCSWTEGREEGLTFNQEMEDLLSAPRKRIRAPSDTNRDGLLFKKRKRAQSTRYDPDSDTESEDGVVIEGGSPRARYDSPASSHLAFTTPLKLPLASTGEEVYDIEMEDCDKGATQGLLFSGVSLRSISPSNAPMLTSFVEKITFVFRWSARRPLSEPPLFHQHIRFSFGQILKLTILRPQYWVPPCWYQTCRCRFPATQMGEAWIS